EQVAENSLWVRRVAELSHEDIQPFAERRHVRLSGLSANAHGNVVQPRKRPGIPFKLFVELHAEHFAGNRKVIAESQHEIARQKVLRQRLPQATARTRRQYHKIRAISFL